MKHKKINKEVIMKKQKLYLVCILVIGVIVSGCAPSMRVPVTRPAEINLRGINKIAIGEISGNCGQEMYDLLTSKLFESGKFDVLDRANLDKIMKEHNLTLGGAVDEKTAAKMGELVGAASLVFGNVSLCKYEEKKTVGIPWTDKDGGYHKAHYVTGTAKITVTFKVVGMQTGKILAAKTISKEATDYNSADNRWPESPNGDAIKDTARNGTIAAFMKMISPYTEYVSVTFAENDSKVPEMAQGVNYAKKGMWNEALENFKTATQKNPAHAGAWFNLGLAYEYTSMFKEAEAAFNEANKIKPCDECMNEIANTRLLAAERKKLEEQGVIAK
ncbi:MAG: tetratricopeptide repeat protein [Deltaproteobacteria bacterium]|nr:tetratricopeptide repeat protein [Deltaproteobacteria bacterium]